MTATTDTAKPRRTLRLKAQMSLAGLTTRAAVLERLQRLWPDAFGQALAIGIHEQVLAAPWQPPLSPEQVKLVGAALALHCSKLSYVRRVRDGAGRCNLDGSPAGEVTPAEQAHAAERLLKYAIEMGQKKRARALAYDQQRDREVAAKRARKARLKAQAKTNMPSPAMKATKPAPAPPRAKTFQPKPAAKGALRGQEARK